MKIEYAVDWREIDNAAFDQLEDIRQSLYNRIAIARVQAQNTCVQEVIDAGENPEDYMFHESEWWEDNIYNYKCWRVKK